MVLQNASQVAMSETQVANIETQEKLLDNYITLVSSLTLRWPLLACGFAFSPLLIPTDMQCFSDVFELD